MSGFIACISAYRGRRGRIVNLAFPGLYNQYAECVPFFEFMEARVQVPDWIIYPFMEETP